MVDSKEGLSILASSLLAGLVYWLVVGGKYMVLSLTGGSLPIDALIMLFPILLFSGGVGIIVCMPIFVVLRKYELFSMRIVVAGAILVSFLVVLLITNEHPSIINYIGSTLAAISGSLLLFKMLKNSSV